MGDDASIDDLRCGGSDAQRVRRCVDHIGLDSAETASQLATPAI
jgi:hypothetical protein